MSLKAYSGVGSRKTPPDVLSLMTKIASFLEKQGYVLYSGGADGADSAFEAGVSDEQHKKIFLPWQNFNNNKSSLCSISKSAYALAYKFHPKWSELSDTSKLLIARDGYQVLGEDLESPVEFIICYTPHGKIEGGTGQAMRIALYHKIPILNLFYESDRNRIGNWMNTEIINHTKSPEIESWKLI